MNLRRKKSVISKRISLEKGSKREGNLKRKKNRDEKKSRKHDCRAKNSSDIEENSILDRERNKHELRKNESNVPGKYRRMNSGKYVPKPTKHPSFTSREKTFIHFDEGIVKIIGKFLDRLHEQEIIKITKKKKNPENRKFSDELKSKMPPKEILYRSVKINDSSANSEKQDQPIMVNNSNIYYNFGLSIYPPQSVFNEQKSSGYHPMNHIFVNKGADPNMIGHLRMRGNNCETSLQGKNYIRRMGQEFPMENESRKIFISSKGPNPNRPQKDIIHKNTPNHITAARFIKRTQESILDQRNEDIQKKSGQDFASKNSTESEKSDEKLSLSNSYDQNNTKLLAAIADPLQKKVESVTKSQLDQINEIVTGNRKE